MSSPSPQAGKRRLTTRETTLLAIMGALMFATQVAMASLPNIHIVAVLIILSTFFFRWRALYAIFVFDLLEGIMYGFGIWWISYLYIWVILVALVMLLGKSSSSLFWACIAGVYGLSFGAFCSIPYLFIGGPSMAFAYWVSGITFDLIHCGGNFVMTLVLIKPLYRAMALALGSDKPNMFPKAE